MMGTIIDEQALLESLGYLAVNKKGLATKMAATFGGARAGIELREGVESLRGYGEDEYNDAVIERLSFIKPGENAWTADLPDHLKLNVKGAKMSMIYKRLDPNKPAYTITGSGGGGTHVYHWKENRALTNRERARLQTFPDNFEFFGSKESVRKQIGMAVPVLGAKIILESVLKTFANIDYPSIKENYDYR